MNFESNKTKNRIFYVELLRIIAIFFVIFNHTNQRGFVLFSLYEIGSFEYWFFMFFSLIAGISVPIFFMISGMFLLGKHEETIGYIWKHRIPKYVLVLIVFSFFHYLRISGFDLRTISIKEYFRLTYTNGVIIPYWFIYAYIAFLIALPFIRKMAKNINEREFLYLVGLYIFFNGIIFILQYIISNGTINLHGNLSPSILFGDIVFYPLIGYYLGNQKKTVNTKSILVCCILFLVSILLTAYLTDYKINLTGELEEETVITFYNSTRPMQVIFLFLIAKKAFENRKMPRLVEKAVLCLGRCTFGIYLIEEALRESLYFIYDKMCAKMDYFPAIILYVLMILCLGWLIIYLGKLIDLMFICLYRIVLKKRNTHFT